VWSVCSAVEVVYCLQSSAHAVRRVSNLEKRSLHLPSRWFD
jgi:hypothetical protein